MGGLWVVQRGSLGRMFVVLLAILLMFGMAAPVAAQEDAQENGSAPDPSSVVVIDNEDGATRRAPVATASVAASAAAQVAEVASHNTTGINILWTNRGAVGDGFDAVFGAGAPADAARANVDAAIEGWKRVITSLNRLSTPGDDTLSITITMNPGANATSTSCGGGASGNFDGDGWPTGGNISVTGNAFVWFIDPTPLENSEFTGNIDNAFSGDAQAGSPANGLCDIYTVVNAEIVHILGITNAGGSKWLSGGFNTQLTTTGTTCSGPGDLWQFTGPTLTALMTSNNGGGGGSDFGVPIHTAEPCASNSGLSGANDSGNALFEGSRRYIPGNLVARVLRDTYNFSIVEPEAFGTFYSVLNSTNGTLVVTGGDDNDDSVDVVSITRSGGEITVSVDVGSDIAGTGPTDAFVSRYDVGEVQSITVNSLDGDDTVTVSEDIGVPVTVNGGDDDDTLIGGGNVINGGAGNDFITGSVGPDTLNGDGGNDTIFGFEGPDVINGGTGNDEIHAGPGDNTVTDGTGNDIVDLSENSVPINYTTGGGNDTVVGTAFDDTITGTSGSDFFEGGEGDDTLVGNSGSDQLFGQGGSDLVIWNSGDGSDLIEGGPGENDTVQVTASAGGDNVSISATPGSRVDLSIGASTLDIADVEDFAIDAGGGSDLVDVGDLSTTTASTVDIDVGTGTDGVTVEGTGTDDLLVADPVGGSQVEVGGLSYDVSITSVGSTDTLTLDGAVGNDIIVVNGTAGSDSISIDMLVANGADIGGAVPPTVVATGAETLVVDGEGGNDAFSLETPLFNNAVTVSRGALPDEGTVSVAGLILIQFRDLGATGSVELTDAGGGRADDLTYLGTSVADSFNVAAGTGSIVLNGAVPVIPTGVADLELRGLAGADDFSGAAVFPFTTMLVDGGNSAADQLTLSGAAGPVTVDFDTATVSGYGGIVSMAAIESLVTQQAGGALNVDGTAGDDTLSYTPTGAGDGTIALDSSSPTLSFSGVGGTLTIDPGGGNDNVAVVGTLGQDTISALVEPTTMVQVDSTLAVAIPQASTEVLSILAGDGADLIQVTTFDTVSAILFVDGGEPSSKKNSDKIEVTNGGPSKVKFLDQKSHVKEEGSIFATYRSTGAETRIDYRSVEKLKFFR